jgi:predicted glycosyltransferase
MKVWYDACTGKHLRYGIAIARRLRTNGHEVVLTVREHPDTLPLAKHLKEEVITVGKYDPTSLFSRLKESTKRQLSFCEMFEKKPPDIAISHQSIELCRVAFGLGIPNIATHDTPHAEAANRLTMPIINYLVFSKALPLRHIRGYGIKKLFRFEGVDEVAWIKDFKPTTRYNFGKPLIVVRELQTKASYAEGKEDLTKTLTRKLAKLGNVLFLSRYEKGSEKGIIIPDGFVDSASLVADADLVISIGGTIAREAALQGTPTIIIPLIGRFHVNDYLAKKGFPIFTVSLGAVAEYAKKILGKKWNVKPLLDRLENPVDIIERIVTEETEQQ